MQDVRKYFLFSVNRDRLSFEQHILSSSIDNYDRIEKLKQAYKDSLEELFREVKAQKSALEFVTLQELKLRSEICLEKVRTRVQDFIEQLRLCLRLPAKTSSDNVPINSSGETATIHQSNLTHANLEQSSASSESESCAKFGKTSLRRVNMRPAIYKTTSFRLPNEAREILKEWMRAKPEDPYPTQEEKLVLAARTGLTPSQVNNWFVNFRVRKLKFNRNSRKRKLEKQVRESLKISKSRGFQ